MLWTVPLGAETRALLIGVSDYDDTIGLSDLRGPRNDVALMRRVLGARGVSDITVLADGIENAARPTRAAILAGFADMAARARPGDLVYLHMSGHGTRQADRNGDETDGQDEVFLPADTARAEPGSNVIPNALVDDEIGAAVDAIRATGADVWLVMDNCHSGSGMRAGILGTAARFIDPAVLGVDLRSSAQVEAQIVETPENPGGGGLLAFYSARSSEVALEVAFPAEDGGEIWYGLFTAKLAARLDSDAALSYRQLFQAVLRDMNDTTVPGGARLQTPLWDGTMIDAAVFGGADTSGLRRFALINGKVQAGKLHGLEDGTVLGLVADPADPPDAIIGYAQMRRTKAATASLSLVDAACLPRSDQPCDAIGSLPPEARYAQVMARPVDLVVRLAPPRRIEDGTELPATDPAYLALNAALDRLNDGRGTALRLDAANADVEIYLAEGVLWFGPRAVIGTSAVGLPVAPEVDALTDALLRIRRAEDLARLLSSVSTKPSILAPSPVRVEIAMNQVAVGDLQPVGSAVPPYEECEIAQDADQSAPLPLPASADLKQCDQLDVSAIGTVAGARDVNRIHIDARYCVHASHERVEGASQAARIGRGMIMCSDCPDGYSAGEERLFVVVTEAEANTEALNLEGLVETCAHDAAATRGGAEADVISFLTGLAQRPGTRGSFGSAGVADVWVERFDWRVLPRTEAFLKAGRAPDK